MKTTNNVTIFEALQWANIPLKALTDVPKAAFQNPKLDAQILLADCLEKPTSYLFAHSDEALSPEVQARFEALIARRSKHEPIAYLLGRKDFYGRTFMVTPATLIPRPETEVLVDLAKRAITSASTVIDVGTGSGTIALTLAAETGMHVIAVDDDLETLGIAEQNAKQLGVLDRVQLVHAHLLAGFMPERGGHIVITANLPYLASWQWDTLDPDVKLFEPRHALIGGHDGLALYDEILHEMKAISHEMSRRGDPVHFTAIFEIDPSQQRTCPDLIASHFPNADIQVIKDMSNRVRFVAFTS